MLLRLSEVEQVCPGLGSYGWSHAMERLWLMLLDVERPLAPLPDGPVAGEAGARGGDDEIARRSDILCRGLVGIRWKGI